MWEFDRGLRHVFRKMSELLPDSSDDDLPALAIAAATAAAEVGFAELQVKIIDKQAEDINPDDFELKAQ